MRWLFSWALELLVLSIRGIFMLIGKWRLKAIRKGVEIEPTDLSVETGSSPFPQVRLTLKVTTKTDGKVNVNNLIAKLNYGDWEICRSVFNIDDGLPQAIGRRENADIILIINPPIYFWVVAPEEVKVKGELSVSSIWGSTTLQVKTTTLPIADTKGVALRFLTEFEKQFVKLTKQ